MDLEKSNWFTQKLINYLKALGHDGSDLQEHYSRCNKFI